jgi:hypothetical protein
MAMRGSVLEESNFGVVYTPRKWAEWALVETGIFERWLAGDTVLDPTVGDGSFILSLLNLAREKKIKISKKMVNNLFGFDLKQSGIDSILKEAKEKFEVILLSENFVCTDVATTKFTEKFDCIIGNPPWVSFAKLPPEYKEILKARFIEYGLTNTNNTLLLGSSRVDLAALIVNVAIADLAKESTTIAFFLPGSMFFGGSAHEAFRNFEVKGKPYGLVKIFDFGMEPIFNSSAKHGTSFVFAEFNKNYQKGILVEKRLDAEGNWISLDPNNGNISLSVDRDDKTVKKYKLPLSAKPRQGVNTGGHNSIFFGTVIDGDLNSEYLTFMNLDNEVVEIESKWVFPLIMRQNIKDGLAEPVRYVILCHDPDNGKPISHDEMKKYPKTLRYFETHSIKLLARKGVMLNARNKNGEFWGLLGVGSYSFQPYKVVWLSAGEKELKPKLFDSWQGKSWQSNQSMQAFCPAQSKEQAMEIASVLQAIASELDPRLLGMPGTLSWGQPGKMKECLEFH